MYNRLISLPKDKSFFLFGQRGAGKSTLLNRRFKENALEISLLDSKNYLNLSKSPWGLKQRVLAKKPEHQIVIIDEIQRIPELLNEVHKLIEEENIVFALTGSSARKLKKQGVNLLAGRAQDFKLYSLSYKELGEDFNLNNVLKWGSLPQVMVEKDNLNKEEYLYSYVNNYLKEEIILEQVVRQIEPFNRFLEVAAQLNGKVISYSNIARDVGLSDVTIKTYFNILEDTLIGFFLPVYHTSIRKKQKLAPKFYFNDIGLVRTLQNRVSIEVNAQTYEYGSLFESFIINEFVKLNEYTRSRFKLSFLRVGNKDEIDLIVEKPNKEILLFEIKSRDSISENEVKDLNTYLPSFKENYSDARAFCLSRDLERKKIGEVLCLHWREGLEEVFSI